MVRNWKCTRTVRVWEKGWIIDKGDIISQETIDRGRLLGISVIQFTNSFEPYDPNEEN